MYDNILYCNINVAVRRVRSYYWFQKDINIRGAYLNELIPGLDNFMAETMNSDFVPKKFDCPECALNGETRRMRRTSIFHTDWYGILVYYRCSRIKGCGNKFVVSGDNEPEIVNDAR